MNHMTRLLINVLCLCCAVGAVALATGCATQKTDATVTPSDIGSEGLRLRTLRGQGLRAVSRQELLLLRREGAGHEGVWLRYVQCKGLRDVRPRLRRVQVPSRACRRLQTMNRRPNEEDTGDAGWTYYWWLSDG